MSLVWTLIGALVAGGAFFLIRWILEARRISSERGATPRPTPLGVAIGLVTNFFDTLGIGSFATTTAAFRLFRLVPDELIPGTIIVGGALTVLTQAVLFISVVEVDPLQLTALIVVCVAGGWLGAGVVTSLSRRAIRLGIGTALVVAAVFMVFGMLGSIPAGGAGSTARALTPTAFVLALAINFALGALLPLGIGNYAPSLVMFSLLGMDPRAAFPIMMGSGAFVATVAGARFLSARRFHQQAALALALGGIPGVLAAVWLVKSLPLEALRVLVLAVVLYVAVTLLRSGLSRDADVRDSAETLRQSGGERFRRKSSTTDDASGDPR